MEISDIHRIRPAGPSAPSPDNVVKGRKDRRHGIQQTLHPFRTGHSGTAHNFSQPVGASDLRHTNGRVDFQGVCDK